VSEIKKLSIVVSCFNEEENLLRYQAEVLPLLEKLSIPFELILVNDGSSDGTPSVVRELQSHYPTVLLATHPSNRGLGAGLKTGFAISSGDTIVTMDADLTFHPRSLMLLIDAYKEGYDVVLGSPFIGGMEGVHFIRKFLSRAVNVCYQVLLQKKITATSSIFRIYKASLIKGFSLQSSSFDINAEILFKAIQAGARIKEVPVVLGRREKGESKIVVTREIRNHLKMFSRIVDWRFFRH